MLGDFYVNELSLEQSGLRKSTVLVRRKLMINISFQPQCDESAKFYHVHGCCSIVDIW